MAHPTTTSIDIRGALRGAITATVLAAIVLLPSFTLHLERAGARTTIVPNWSTLVWGCLAVFVVQLLRPLLLPRLPTVKLPSLPSFEPGRHRVLMLAVLVAAVA